MSAVNDIADGRTDDFCPRGIGWTDRLDLRVKF